MTEKSRSSTLFSFGCAGKASRESLAATVVLCVVLIGNAFVGLRLGPVVARWTVLVVIAAAIWFVREHIRNLRQHDELQIRIYFEGLAWGSLGVFLLAMLWPSLQRAELVGRFEPEFVTIGLLVGFCTGYVNALRRYR